jgi:hypothetical protein
VHQTCPFDSTMKILLFGALDYPPYEEVIQSSNNLALKFVETFLKSGTTTAVLKERISILKKIYEPRRDPNAISVSSYSINAHDSIRGVCEKLFLDKEKMQSTEPSLLKTYQYSNSECIGRENSAELFLTINIRTIGRFGIQALGKALNYFPQIFNIKCDKSSCTGNIIETRSLNKHILIQLDFRTTIKPRPPTQCSLRDFPVSLDFNKEYRYEMYT